MKGLTRAAVVLIAVAVLALQVSWAAPARACSCIDMRDPQMLADSLNASQAAFVGSALTREDAGAGRAKWIFEVEAVVKGELPDRAEVMSSADGASCGIELQQGQRSGMLLNKVDGAWEGSLCGQIDAEMLLATGESHPPSSEGDAADGPASPADEADDEREVPVGWMAAGAALALAVGGGALGLQRARARRT